MFVNVVVLVLILKVRNEKLMGMGVSVSCSYLLFWWFSLKTNQPREKTYNGPINLFFYIFILTYL